MRRCGPLRPSWALLVLSHPPQRLAPPHVTSALPPPVARPSAVGDRGPWGGGPAARARHPRRDRGAPRRFYGAWRHIREPLAPRGASPRGRPAGRPGSGLARPSAGLSLPSGRRCGLRPFVNRQGRGGKIRRCRRPALHCGAKPSHPGRGRPPKTPPTPLAGVAGRRNGRGPGSQGPAAVRAMQGSERTLPRLSPVAGPWGPRAPLPSLGLSLSLPAAR